MRGVEAIRRGVRAGLIAAVTATLLGGCGRTHPEEAVPAVTVGTALAARHDLPEILTLRGRLVPPPAEDATLAPQVGGRLVALTVREGDAVAPGSLLASVDQRQLDEAESSASAALSKAREDEDVRSRAAALSARLFEKGIASREERDNDRAALETARSGRVDAEARLSQAKRQRGWAELRAPFGGVVAQVLRHQGEIVDGTAATPVLRLLGTAVQEVSADASPADLSRVGIGADVTVRAPGAGPAYPGRVVRVARTVDPATGIGEVRARLLRKSPAPLLSSMAMSVVVTTHRGVVAVPAEALRRSDSGVEEVVLVEKGVAKVRQVRSEFRSDGLVEIAEGLSGGETVVVDSPLGLGDGVPLKTRTKSP